MRFAIYDKVSHGWYREVTDNDLSSGWTRQRKRKKALAGVTDYYFTGKISATTFPDRESARKAIKRNINKLEALDCTVRKF